MEIEGKRALIRINMLFTCCHDYTVVPGGDSTTVDMGVGGAVPVVGGATPVVGGAVEGVLLVAGAPLVVVPLQVSEVPVVARMPVIN